MRVMWIDPERTLTATKHAWMAYDNNPGRKPPRCIQRSKPVWLRSTLQAGLNSRAAGCDTTTNGEQHARRKNWHPEPLHPHTPGRRHATRTHPLTLQLQLQRKKTCWRRFSQFSLEPRKNPGWGYIVDSTTQLYVLGSKLPLFPYTVIGDGHQPNSRGLYTHYKDSLLKVGWPSPIQRV